MTDKKKLKVFTAFSGYDSQCMALDRLKENFPDFDYELIGWSEIDEPAIQSHNAVFPQYADRNYGDISKINWDEVDDIDLFTYSSPCVTGDSLILTDTGYKIMDDVNVGDRVVGKDGKFHNVLKKFDNGVKKTCFVQAMGTENIHCTLNHKFYVRTKHKTNDFSEPEFIEAQDLNKTHYLGVPVNDESVNVFGINDEIYWYLCGLYVGDGHLVKSNNKEIILSLNETKLQKLLKRIKGTKYESLLTYKLHSESVYRVIYKDVDFYAFLNTYFGKYSLTKYIHYDVLRLPNNLLQAFYDGYFDSDGCMLSNQKNTVQFSSVSRNLIYMISAIVNKLYHRPGCIYKVKRPSTHIIEGRVVNQHDWYQYRVRLESIKPLLAFYEDGYMWYPFDKIVEAEDEHVYDIEVDDVHSYIVQGAIVHNCTDFSICGKQLGGEEGSGTRSSLLWECKRCIEAKRPKYLILENVKALVSEKFKPLFLRWKKTVDDYGYDSYWEVLNSRDYDVPQNRERVFLVSIRRDNPEKMERYYFPAPMEQKRQITDFLEKKVPEEYYLSEKKIPLFFDLLNNAGVDYEEVSEYADMHIKRQAPKVKKEEPVQCCEADDSSLISFIEEENRKKEEKKNEIPGGYRPDFNKLF